MKHVAKLGLALSLGFGMIMASSGPGVSQLVQDSIDSNRDSVVQSVRDNVRRQIRANENSSARMETMPRAEKRVQKRPRNVK